MSDTALYERPANTHRSVTDRSITSRLNSTYGSLGQGRRSLASLPFDVLLSIALELDTDDITAVMTTCTTLREFALTRSLWLSLAANMLNKCQPLPIIGFSKLSDLSTEKLARTIQLASRLQHAWATRKPRLTSHTKFIDAPPGEDIVWLSPITSKYMLCCTKTGKVLCWDVHRGNCVAEWASGEDWEIWKCRVEFDERVVYFAMAKRLSADSGTDCLLMALTFPPEVEGTLPEKPVFEELCCFRFPGSVISVYLLDPLQRTLSAYIYVASTGTIGLYMLLDWNNPSYTFLDTGIPHAIQREWSCIGYDPANVVIHSEDTDSAFQCFYPMAFLKSLSSTTPPSFEPPRLISPTTQMTLPFLNSPPPFAQYVSQSSHFVRQWWPTLPNSKGIRRRSCAIVLLSYTVPQPEAGHENDVNPALMGLRYAPDTNIFVIAQHYFSIPLDPEQLRWWYTREPFEIICFPHHSPAVDDDVVPPNDGDVDAADPPVPPVVPVAEADNADGEGAVEAEEPAVQQIDDQVEENVHNLPLIAVDFGCAVWLEYAGPASEERRLRFVSFPDVEVDRNSDNFNPLSDDVRTLDVPEDVDLSRVCHIGIDQAQCSVILGLTSGRVVIMRYE